MSGEKRRYSFFPKTLSQCVEPLTRPILKTQGLAGSRILTEWASIVGQHLSRHAVPEKLSFPQGKKTGGTLVISTESGFATELQHMQPVILERLAGYFGYQAISRITISHSWTPVAKTAAPKLVSSCTIDPAILNHIEDDELKTALVSFASSLSGKAS